MAWLLAQAAGSRDWSSDDGVKLVFVENDDRVVLVDVIDGRVLLDRLEVSSCTPLGGRLILSGKSDTWTFTGSYGDEIRLSEEDAVDRDDVRGYVGVHSATAVTSDWSWTLSELADPSTTIAAAFEGPWEHHLVVYEAVSGRAEIYPAGRKTRPLQVIPVAALSWEPFGLRISSDDGTAWMLRVLDAEKRPVLLGQWVTSGIVEFRSADALRLIDAPPEQDLEEGFPPQLRGGAGLIPDMAMRFGLAPGDVSWAFASHGHWQCAVLHDNGSVVAGHLAPPPLFPDTDTSTRHTDPGGTSDDRVADLVSRFGQGATGEELLYFRTWIADGISRQEAADRTRSETPFGPVLMAVDPFGRLTWWTRERVIGLASDADSVVYGTSGGVRCRDANSGRIRWTKLGDFNDWCVGGGVAITSQGWAPATESNRLEVFDAGTGEWLWSLDPEPEATVTKYWVERIDRGRLFVKRSQDYRIDEITMRRRYDLVVIDSSTAQILAEHRCTHPGLLFADDVIVVGVGPQQFAVDRRSLRRRDMPGEAALGGTRHRKTLVGIHRDVLLIKPSSSKPEVLGVASATGTTLWSAPIGVDPRFKSLGESLWCEVAITLKQINPNTGEIAFEITQGRSVLAHNATAMILNLGSAPASVLRVNPAPSSISSAFSRGDRGE